MYGILQKCARALSSSFPCYKAKTFMNVTESYNQFNKWKGLLQAILSVFHIVWWTQLGVQMRAYVTVKFQMCVDKFARATCRRFTGSGWEDLNSQQTKTNPASVASGQRETWTRDRQIASSYALTPRQLQLIFQEKKSRKMKSKLLRYASDHALCCVVVYCGRCANGVL